MLFDLHPPFLPVMIVVIWKMNVKGLDPVCSSASSPRTREKKGAGYEGSKERGGEGNGGLKFKTAFKKLHIIKKL